MALCHCRVWYSWVESNIKIQVLKPPIMMIAKCEDQYGIARILRVRLRFLIDVS